MAWSLFHAFWTLVLMGIFVGIVIWAWSSKRRRHFEEAARIPLEDDGSLPDQEEQRHG